jgi:phosphoglucomutase/phosphomannomutase
MDIGFILGTEESHGYLMGSYCRDKDAACAAVWIAEHAAELKKHNRNLLDDLSEIYAKYGYCHNYLTEIRLLGAKGIEQISQIMEHLRNTKIEAFVMFGRKSIAGKENPSPIYPARIHLPEIY